MRVRILMAALLLAAPLFAPSTSHAQWVNHPTPDLPRTADGKPNLAAPAPRTGAHGTPDLSGVWQAEPAPIPELIKMLPGGQNGLGEDIPSKYFINILADYSRGREPLQPKAAAYAARLSIDAIQHDDVGINCLPSGLPLFMMTPAPFKIVQTRGGFPYFEVDVTAAKANPTDLASLALPPAPAAGAGGLAAHTARAGGDFEADHHHGRKVGQRKIGRISTAERGKTAPCQRRAPSCTSTWTRSTRR